VGKKLEKAGRAERMLALHDELDGLDRKESYLALSLVLLVVAIALIVAGMSRGSAYLEVNGLFFSFGAVFFGMKEVSKARRMKALGRQIAEIETEGEGGEGQGALGRTGDTPFLKAPD
jgi:hypothetical protein